MNVIRRPTLISARTSRSLLTVLVCAVVFCISRVSLANDLRITNQSNLAFDSLTGTADVEFDIQWQNSWRTVAEPNNWDATWVFLKIRVNGGDWKHLKLTDSGHTVPSSPMGVSLSLGLQDTSLAYNASTNPAIGVFLYRSNDGFGTFSAADVRLRWNYADNDVQSTDSVEIKVFGVEMVYVPEGPFYAGDNATSGASFKQGSADNDPWYISSESAAINVTDAVSDGYYYTSSIANEQPTGPTFTIPAAFPKGYASFYIMKGEITQNQWVRFFNTLTTTQKGNRDVTVTKGDSLSYRNNVSYTSGDATLPDNGGGATYAGVAMTYISWADLLAHLDWAGLRPMSELEYEKAARGPLPPVSGEYACGTATVTQATSVSNGGLPSERTQSGSNMIHNGSIAGPVRVGSFASGVNNRVAAGGGYYGAMELSGNVFERAITVGTTDGRGFQARYHGDGVLTSTGEANVTSWTGTDYWSSAGSGLRGGAWEMGSWWCRTSTRGYAAYSSWRGYSTGGRGVRSSP